MKKLIKPISFIAQFAIVAAMSTVFVSSTSANQTYTGTEDNVIDITPIKAASILTFTYEGEGVFTASPIDSAGTEGLSYSLEIGSFTGTYFQKTPSKPITALSIKGEGQWSVKISPLKSAPVLGAKMGSGNGTSVISIGKATTGSKRITWKHDGEGVFVVTPISAKGVSSFPLFLKIGAYNGTVMMKSGVQYFEVKADGNWSYSIK
jgi:hypothetical protein